jgi:hypothetical protein
VNHPTRTVITGKRPSTRTDARRRTVKADRSAGCSYRRTCAASNGCPCQVPLIVNAGVHAPVCVRPNTPDR